jgi:hypothetical protein
MVAQNLLVCARRVAARARVGQAMMLLVVASLAWSWWDLQKVGAPVRSLVSFLPVWSDSFRFS